MWPLHIYVVVTLAANTNAKNISTHCAQREPQAVHKLQSKSQTNALEPSSAALAFVSVSLALESCVLNIDPLLVPLLLLLRYASGENVLLACKGALAQVASLPFSLPNACHLPAEL